MNKIFLEGYVASEPYLSQTESGIPVCNFMLAADSGTGEHKRIDYIRIVVWGAAGETAVRVLKKDSRCLVFGRLQIRTVDKPGRRLYYTEVISEEIKFL